MARQSEWEKAKSDLERARRLREKDEISETEFESIELAETAARAALRASEAQLDQARIDFDHTRVRSPIRGMISDTFCEAGELVVAGTPIANVVDLAEMKVRVMLSSEEVAQVSVGDSVRVAVPAYAGEIYSGSVRFISPKADERTRTFHAEVLVENRGEALKAGMVASVRIDVGEVQDALLVPRESVLEEYGERVVFTVLNGRAVRNQVEVTEVDGGRVRVLSGLSPGDRVVVAGQQNLQDGTPVVEQ